MPVNPSRVTTESFLLDISGVPAGTLSDFDGLDLEADVSRIRNGGDTGPGHKQVTAVHWTPARAVTGLPMDKPLADWLQASVEHPGTTRDGVLTVADAAMKIRSRWSFAAASLAEIAFPRLDGASREAGRIGITWQAEHVTWNKDSGAVNRPAGLRRKAWLASNFRVEIDGLPCERVASIDAFTWTCTMTAVTDIGRVFADVTVPDLTLTISDADLPAWSDTLRAWFIDGQHSDAKERNGRILLLAPDMNTTLAEITLGHIGFRRFVRRAPAESAQATQAAGRFVVGLYVETMGLKIPS